MRLGVLSDIHANRVALDAVLADLPTDLDHLLCLGDLVGYNPWPAECVTRIRNLDQPTTIIAGNHDHAVANPERYQNHTQAYAGLQHAAAALSADQLAWLEALPQSQTLADGAIKLVHSHPVHRGTYVYPEQFPTLAQFMASEDVLCLGHTHIQAHGVVDGTLIVNPGSVGQPRDGDPRAAYSVVETETHDVVDHRVAYDIDAVQTAIHKAGLPAETAHRLADGQ